MTPVEQRPVDQRPGDAVVDRAAVGDRRVGTPASEVELAGRTGTSTFATFRRDVGRHHLTLSAAGVAFYAFVSLVPALVAAASIYGLVASPAQAQRLVATLASHVPPQVGGFIDQQMRSVVATTPGALRVGAVIGILTALYSASSAMGNMMTALDVTFDVTERRGFVRRRLVALGLTFGALLTAAACGTVLTLAAGVGGGGQVAVRIGAWVVAALVVAIALAVLYRYGADHPGARWRWVTPGAVIGVAAFVAVTVGLRFYVADFGSYRTYGSLAAIVITLMWFYLTAIAVLIGAEVDAARGSRTVPAPAGDDLEPARP